jgi:probable rRNA maturation factor
MITIDEPEPPANRAALTRFLRSAQKAVGVDGEVSVLITSSREMRRLNKLFRKKDKPTDVLSFPAESAAGEDLLGDIAISAEIAHANADRLGHSYETELRILMLHGLLHLAGYDHEQDSGHMAELEAKLRAKLKLPVGLIERARATA